MAKQYRPSLSLAQISHILATYQALPQNTDAVVEITAKLGEFYYKASVGAVRPAHTSSSLQESLGLLGESDGAEDEVGKVEYEKYRKCPAACTTKERVLALEYGYLNDLLNGDEITQYEYSQGVSAN